MNILTIYSIRRVNSLLGQIVDMYRRRVLFARPIIAMAPPFAPVFLLHPSQHNALSKYLKEISARISSKSFAKVNDLPSIGDR